MVFTFESVDEILKCDHSNENYWAVLSGGIIYYATQSDSTSESVDEIHNVFFGLLIWSVFACETIQSNILRTMLLVRWVRSVFFEKKKNNNNNNRLRHISLTTCRSSDLLFSCRTTSSTCKIPQKSLIFGGLHEWSKGYVTRDDLQRWFFEQHSTAMLEECCNHLNQCRNNVATPCCA